MDVCYPVGVRGPPGAVGRVVVHEETQGTCIRYRRTVLTILTLLTLLTLLTVLTLPTGPTVLKLPTVLTRQYNVSNANKILDTVTTMVKQQRAMFVALLVVAVLALVVLSKPIAKLYEPFVSGATISPQNMTTLDSVVCRMVAQAFLTEAMKLPTKGAAPKCEVFTEPARAQVDKQVQNATKLSEATREKLKDSASKRADVLQEHLLQKQCAADTKAVISVGALQKFLGRFVAMF